MGLDAIVNLSITKQTVSPSRLGFGVPLIAAYHNVFPDLTMPFTTLQGMKDAGFLVTDPAYLCASAMFSQNPRPAQVIIGRRSRPYTQTVELKPVNTTAGNVYRFTVVNPSGAKTKIEYIIPGGATVTSVATALAALIDPIADVAATADATKVTVTAPVGKLFDLQGLPSAKYLEVADVTTDPGIADDLSDIYEADPKTWYALTLDHSGPDEISSVATWTEARRKIALLNTSETDIVKAGTSDIAYLLKGANFGRTGLLFSRNRLQPYSAAGWMGEQLPKAPGSSTWMFKTIKTILADVFTDGEIANLESKHCNYYSEIGGVSIASHGYMSTGDADFIDIVHGIDWLYARLQEAVYGGLLANEKVPFTDSGIAAIVSLVDGVLKKGVKATLLAADPAPAVTAPKVKDVDSADKIARHLPDVGFTAKLAGAIHSVDISGLLTP